MIGFIIRKTSRLLGAATLGLGAVAVLPGLILAGIAAENLDGLCVMEGRKIDLSDVIPDAKLRGFQVAKALYQARIDDASDVKPIDYKNSSEFERINPDCCIIEPSDAGGYDHHSI